MVVNMSIIDIISKGMYDIDSSTFLTYSLPVAVRSMYVKFTIISFLNGLLRATFNTVSPRSLIK